MAGSLEPFDITVSDLLNDFLGDEAKKDIVASGQALWCTTCWGEGTISVRIDLRDETYWEKYPCDNDGCEQGLLRLVYQLFV